ncbi:serine/threonine protein kinase [bacterium J17]|nr:serine/threonine protein kinase [bacterium J17]
MSSKSSNTVSKSVIDAFDFHPGKVLAKNFVVVEKLGAGWEGEVYKVREKNTGIERAAKIFFPQRNIRNKAAISYARKLHKLHSCPIVIHYHAEETIIVQKTPVTVLISEFVEGELLSEFLKNQPGKRLYPFAALHFLHSLVLGLEQVHNEKEYHGDLHAENVIISRFGLKFELKLLDFFNLGGPRQEGIRDDICSAVRLFYDVLGGARRYSDHPKEIKYICCGLKRTLCLKRFPRASVLRVHLENMQWE